MLYHHHENFILPLSHDEVVHGKGSLLQRMPGDDWQRFANLRLLLAYQWLFPGKKLLFMGCEIGQSWEWYESGSIAWELLDQGPYHLGLQTMLKELNDLYKREPSLWQADYDHAGFWWIDCGDAENSVLSFMRQKNDGSKPIAVILNLTPVVRSKYRIGLPRGGRWIELINSDSQHFGGSNQGNWGAVVAEPIPCHNQQHSAELTLPPLGVVVFAPDAG